VLGSPGVTVPKGYLRVGGRCGDKRGGQGHKNNEQKQSGWRGVVALTSEKSFHCGGRVPGQETGAVIVRTVWHGFDKKSIVVTKSEKYAGCGVWRVFREFGFPAGHYVP